MNLFADYVQPLTNWLQTNPHWSLFITFFISLTESLAIVGSIVPGSVTMTAIGILAGSGIMRIDLTLLAAILGAVCGDSLSYALGYIYSDRLIFIWPFNKYPNLLKYGKDFFEKHGGKSVLIGRFVGPLRSIIPVIAGIMHMQHWRFFIANFISAIGWSLLYVMPGVLIGAAGHELSTEAATRFFILILLLLVVIWFIGLIIKALLQKFNLLLQNELHQYWIQLLNNSGLARILRGITPANETDHNTTASLFFSALACLLCFLGLLIVTIYTQWLSFFNLPVQLFSQSIHTLSLGVSFIICSQFTSTITLISVFLIFSFWSIYEGYFKLWIYLCSLLIISFLGALLFNWIHFSPRPQGVLVTMRGSSFPAINIVVCTAFYGFMVLYINACNVLLSKIFKILMVIVLGLSGFSMLYLGDYWFTDILASYSLGLFIGLIHWLLYRKTYFNSISHAASTTLIAVLIATLMISTLVSTCINYKTIMHNHTPYFVKHTIAESSWWNQHTPFLPLYRLNRVGQRISMLNIQYDGDLEFLKESLKQYGWIVHNETFVTKLMMRMNTSDSAVKLPLLIQLYENKRPELMMTYTDTKINLILELTIWESNFNLNDSNNPLWIGTVYQNLPFTKNLLKKSNSKNSLIHPLSYMVPALNNFTLRRIKVPVSMLKTSSFPTTPDILLIKVNEPLK